MDPVGSPQTPARKTDKATPFAARRTATRQAARLRMRQVVRTPLSSAQKAVDPLSHERSGSKRTAAFAGWVVAAVALHALAVLTGVWLGGRKHDFKRDEQQVKIEVREPPPPPPPPPPEPAPPPEPEPPAKVEKTPPPKVTAAPPPPQAEPPPPQPDKPPPRVVGLSLDSTTEGGNGPAFAVGNTREGQTGKNAADPTKVAPVGGGPIVEQPTEAPNRVASRIPTVGLVFTPAKRKREVKPRYPETLKSQGIEGDVVVMVSLDATGKVTGVKIVKPAVQPELNESAKQAALQEEFEPAQKNGVDVPTSITFTYRFRLEES